MVSEADGDRGGSAVGVHHGVERTWRAVQSDQGHEPLGVGADESELGIAVAEELAHVADDLYQGEAPLGFGAAAELALELFHLEEEALFAHRSVAVRLAVDDQGVDTSEVLAHHAGCDVDRVVRPEERDTGVLVSDACVAEGREGGEGEECQGAARDHPATGGVGGQPRQGIREAHRDARGSVDGMS